MNERPNDAFFPPRLSFRSEVGRKLIHLFGLVLPLTYVVLGPDMTIPLMVCGSLVILGADVARLCWPPARRFYSRTFGRLSRQTEERRLTGASLLMIGQTLAALLFPHEVVPAAMTFGVLGDVAAALVGKRFGRRFRRKGKSVAGSVGFLCAAFLGGLVWGRLSWPVVLAGAFAATAAEGLFTRLDDNLVVPFAGGLVMWALLG